VTYKETVAAFCKEYGYSKQSVRAFFADFTEFIMRRLAENESVRIKGLITFDVKNENRSYFDFQNMKSYEAGLHRIPIATLSETFKNMMVYQLNG